MEPKVLAIDKEYYLTFFLNTLKKKNKFNLIKNLKIEFFLKNCQLSKKEIQVKLKFGHLKENTPVFKKIIFY